MGRGRRRWDSIQSLSYEEGHLTHPISYGGAMAEVWVRCAGPGRAFEKQPFIADSQQEEVSKIVEVFVGHRAVPSVGGVELEEVCDSGDAGSFCEPRDGCSIGGVGAIRRNVKGVAQRRASADVAHFVRWCLLVEVDLERQSRAERVGRRPGLLCDDGAVDFAGKGIGGQLHHRWVRRS
jgi:hypothetical protein